MPLGCDCLHVADRKILQLFLHRFIGLVFPARRIPADRDRMGGADGGCRGHRRGAGRNGDETAGTRRGRADRRDIDHHRNRRTQKTLHDRLSRLEQPARRVQLHDQALCVLGARFVNAARNVTGGGRANRAINLNQTNLFCGYRPPAR